MYERSLLKKKKKAILEEVAKDIYLVCFPSEHKLFPSTLKASFT